MLARPVHKITEDTATIQDGLIIEQDLRLTEPALKTVQVSHSVRLTKSGQLIRTTHTYKAADNRSGNRNRVYGPIVEK